MRGIPTWLKVVYTLWMLAWVPTVFQAHGLENYLWMCDVANFVLLIGLWMESPLLISSQATSILLIQAAWTIDLATRLALGFHPFAATAYMFDSQRSLAVRLMSLYHVVIPLLVLWAILRLGYHRRGWQVQCAIAWVVLPLTFLLSDPERNINWLWRPFGLEQTLLSESGYFALCLFAYPLLVYFPTHMLLAWWTRRSNRAELLG